MICTRPIHLRYCSILPAEPVISLKWRGSNYELDFSATNRPERVSFMLNCPSECHSNEGQLVRWLSIFFGEDISNPRQIEDSRFCFVRGRMHVDGESLRRFLNRAERVPFKSYPKWRKELLDHSLNYYIAAVGAGLNLMPVTLGLFAVSIEGLGNAYRGDRKNYRTLGQKPCSEIISSRLGRYEET